MVRAEPSDERGAPSRILLLAHRPLTDASFGGGQRTAHIRDAAGGLRPVDTVVILSSEASSRSSDWDTDRCMTFAYRSGRHGMGWALLDAVRVRRWVAATLAEGDHEVVIARYLSTAVMVPRRYRGRVVLDADDIVKESAGAASFGSRAKAKARHAVVRRLLRQVAHVWFVNPRDLAELGDLARSSSLLPNAAVTYAAKARQPEPATMLIVGNYAHQPNQEAVDFLLRNVLPGLRDERPDIELRIAGAVPAACASTWSGVSHVNLLGFVEDLGAEYSRAALAVAPVFSGGGTQIKLIEALANGCPAIASPFAHAGFAEVLQANRHLYVAGSADEWIAACRRALEDQEGSEQMARSAAEVVRQSYGVGALQRRVRRTIAPRLAADAHSEAGAEHAI